ncbi:hypothetical protein Snoj_29430 [Streptomyces nojiriensis]|uniref:HTH cro/C1-type domain-containing protein n=1 Tax=Streptomyces nojiriensis TaxID=66374 RepID=A0ABQ3SLL6_9ACTN|nr:helix-turn-helix domain-containing protein [Streptomyces nojiriensis]GGS35928.1 hypothetical protein GCM10010205_77550 [Streptomyces nojiriensis]GHI69025.1 hypothetical protein Snoj_29430 [Streptomyces nojiriensis]
MDCTVRFRGALAAELRSLRTEARLTCDELAVKTGLPAAALKRAASGRTVPAVAQAAGQPDAPVRAAAVPQVLPIGVAVSALPLAVKDGSGRKEIGSPDVSHSDLRENRAMAGWPHVDPKGRCRVGVQRPSAPSGGGHDGSIRS